LDSVRTDQCASNYTCVTPIRTHAAKNTLEEAAKDIQSAGLRFIRDLDLAEAACVRHYAAFVMLVSFCPTDRKEGCTLWQVARFQSGALSFVKSRRAACQQVVRRLNSLRTLQNRRDFSLLVCLLDHTYHHPNPNFVVRSAHSRT